jgi:hypothetical protein
MFSMIVELASTLSFQDKNVVELTYQKTLFPAPAIKRDHQCLRKRND